jgi:hypothetical protein
MKIQTNFFTWEERDLGEQAPKLAPKKTEKKEKRKIKILNLFWVA